MENTLRKYQKHKENPTPWMQQGFAYDPFSGTFDVVYCCPDGTVLACVDSRIYPPKATTVGGVDSESDC